MSRRCRASLFERSTGGTSDGLSSGCTCGRLAGGLKPLPCTEPLTYGNQLSDPGFEQIFDLQGQRIDLGRYENIIPGWEWTINDPGTIPRSELLPWWASGENNWFIDDMEARTDSFCLSHEVFSPTGGFIRTGNTLACFFPELFPAVRVGPGDLVAMAIWAKGDQANEVGIRFIGAVADNLGPGGGLPDAIFSPQPVTSTSYQRYEATGFVVAPESYWLFPRWESYRVNNGGMLFVDDAELFLFPPGAGIVLCAQFNFITVVNSTVEEAFL